MATRIRNLVISSPAFDNDTEMDPRFSYSGGNIQPRFEIAGVPEGAAELAIICHDPDAPLPRGFTHWLLYGLPSGTTTIAEDEGDVSFRPGRNGFGEDGYGGPRPPKGHGLHHYYFWVYALSSAVEGTPSREEFLRDYSDLVVEQNRIVGTYEA